MNDQTPQTARPFDPQALEARFAMRVAAALHAQSDALPHDVSERLRVSRQLALQRARQAAATATSATVNGRGAATLAAGGGQPAWWWRLASLVPVVALAVGLVAVQMHHDDDQLRITADIDAALLSDDLPPTAYTDAGFAEFLKTGGAPQTP